MKKIYSAANLPEAHLISHLLEEAGIDHHIFNENLQGGVGELPFTHTYPDIWIVDEAQGERAMEIIRSYEAPRPEGEPAKCGACGEDNPAGFEVCWSCGGHLH